MKKIITLCSLVTIVVFFQSSVKRTKFSGVPPSGLTGATGGYCTNCHGGAALNSGGGSVAVNGLPTGNYVAGQAYNFNLTISHGAANRRRWGFSIKAVNSSGQAVGTFSSTNTNAAPNTDDISELSHNNAVITPDQSSYTYNNLRWVAPATPSAVDQSVTFYYVGNAASGGSGSNGDFIYAGSINNVPLPVTLKDFSAAVSGSTVALNWQTTSEINSDRFEIEKSEDGQFYNKIATVKASSNSTTAKDYSYSDNSPSWFDKPVYYRLKLVDKDNTFKYSKVVTVQLKSGAMAVQNVYPTYINRASEVTAVINSDKAKTLNILLVNASGKALQYVVKTLESGKNTVRFTPPANLMNGTYFIRFSAGSFTQTVSVLVQK